MLQLVDGVKERPIMFVYMVRMLLVLNLATPIRQVEVMSNQLSQNLRQLEGYGSWSHHCNQTQLYAGRDTK